MNLDKYILRIILRNKQKKNNNKLFWRYHGPNKRVYDSDVPGDAPKLSYDPETQERLKRKSQRIKDKMMKRQKKILSYEEIKLRKEFYLVDS